MSEQEEPKGLIPQEAKLRHEVADGFMTLEQQELIREAIRESEAANLGTGRRQLTLEEWRKLMDAADPRRETTSAELKDATTAPSEYSASGTWGEFAARMNSMPLDQREAWFHHHDEAQRRAQNCMLGDHERQIKFYEGRSVEADKLNDRLIKFIGDYLPLVGVDATTIQAENDELKNWIEKYSDAMPGEEWFSYKIDDTREEEILQFIGLMTNWYMTVMRLAVEADDGSPDFRTMVYNMRFRFNPETGELIRVSDEGNIWHTCLACKGPIRYNDAPTGGWWSHAEHPHDEHDAGISG